jgi:hypothetical protein
MPQIERIAVTPFFTRTKEDSAGIHLLDGGSNISEPFARVLGAHGNNQWNLSRNAIVAPKQWIRLWEEPLGVIAPADEVNIYTRSGDAPENCMNVISNIARGGNEASATQVWRKCQFA